MSIRHGVVVLADPADEGDIVLAINARPNDLQVVRRAADLTEVRAAARGRVADLAVLDATDLDLDARIIEDLHRNNMRVVLVSPQGRAGALEALGADAIATRGYPEGIVESLLAIIRASAPLSPSPLDDPLDPLLAPPPPPDTPSPAVEGGSSGEAAPSHRGTVIAVWGASGSPGRSTLALGLAHALGAHDETLIIDADIMNPSLAHMMSVPIDASALAALSRTALRSTLNGDDITRAATPLWPGLSMITGIVTPHRWREVGPASIAAILTAARQAATWVVVDVSSVSLEQVAEDIRQHGERDDVTAAVLRCADEVICVSRADILGVNRLSHAIEWWGTLGRAEELTVVINQVDSAALGSNPLNALQTALSQIIPGSQVRTIPFDVQVRRALLRGRPITEHAPASGAGAAVIALADSLSSNTTPIRRGLFGRRRSVKH